MIKDPHPVTYRYVSVCACMCCVFAFKVCYSVSLRLAVCVRAGVHVCEYICVG